MRLVHVRRSLLVLVVLSLLAPAVVADDDPADYTPVLVPLVSHFRPGAHGSVWDSELFVFNGSHLQLRMLGAMEDTGIPAPVDPAVRVDARAGRTVSLYPLDAFDGAFLYVPNTMVSTTKMSLRVRDTSQNATSLGDDVPVVRIDQAADHLTIIDVPVDPDYRATLRIYGFTPAPMQVGVTVYHERSLTPLAQFEADLNGIVTVVFDPFPVQPAYIAFDPLPAAVRAAATGTRVRIEITNFDDCCTPPLPVAPIWAFVSLTNNETNQVTIVTPK
jgi:hypothetical protein